MNLAAAFDLLRRAIPRPAAGYLFGSVARGEAGPDSDVDLGVLSAAGPIDRGLLHETRLDLELALDRNVDLIDLAVASPILARELMREGQRIDLDEPIHADFWEVRMLRDFEDLKIRRAGIEADIRARGRVYR